MKIDILTMEIEGKLPHWLSPEAKQAALREKIRAKHRHRYEQRQREATAKAKAKAKAKDHDA